MYIFFGSLNFFLINMHAVVSISKPTEYYGKHSEILIPPRKVLLTNFLYSNFSHCAVFILTVLLDFFFFKQPALSNKNYRNIKFCSSSGRLDPEIIIERKRSFLKKVVQISI